MTDPFDALRPIARPLPVGGDDRAVTRGRRILHRRRAAAGGTAAAGLLAVGSVVAFQASGGDRRDSVGVLDSDPAASTSPGAAASAAPTSTSAALPTPTRSPDALGAPTLPPFPGQKHSPRPAQSTPPPSDRPYIGPEPTEDDGAAVYTDSTYSDPNGCLNQPRVMVGDKSGFCIVTEGPTTVTAGKRETFAVTFCRTVASGDVTLHFQNRLEAVIWIYNGQHRYFGFDLEGRVNGGPHARDFKAGDCTRYATTWSGQDQDGYALPEGQATVLFVLVASDYRDNKEQNPGAFSYTDVRWS